MSASTPVDIGLVEEVEVRARGGVQVVPTSGDDRLLWAAVVATLLFTLLRDSQHRAGWAALGAAVGAFVVPRVLAQWVDSDGLVRWAVTNPFGPLGPEPTWYLT